MALLACAACSSDGASKGSAGANPTLATDHPRTNPTLATVPAPTTTTNPYAVPAVIDAAYVNRVLAGLDAAIGDATRLIIRTKTLSQEAFDRLKAVYTSNDLLNAILQLLQNAMANGFSEYKTPPGNTSTVVMNLITAKPGCIFAAIRRDFTAVVISTENSISQWISLRPIEPSRDSGGYNPTSWGITYDGFNRDRSQPANPCSG